MQNHLAEAKMNLKNRIDEIKSYLAIILQKTTTKTEK